MENLKFQDMMTTAQGEKRASVKLKALETLWFNTGTLCNLECQHCYIESSPKNDRLSYLTVDDIKPYLEEIKKHHYPVKLIGITGGEPFLNPSIIDLLALILSYGFEVLVLTNANRVMKRHKEELQKLKQEFGSQLHLRISLDHFSPKIHDRERGQGTFNLTFKELKWLFDQGFEVSIAGRSLLDEGPQISLEGYRRILQEYGIGLDLEDKLIIFPEMRSKRDVPEITSACWDILKVSPDNQMCAKERMVVRRKGDNHAVIMPCTLLAYDQRFILGKALKDSLQEVFLNHPFCAQFCVLGGASCSGTK